MIVINIQKNQTICFQITGMPSLSFLYNIFARRMAGEPSGRAAWQREHNELVQDDSGSLAPAFPHKRRVKDGSCAVREVDLTLNS